MNVWVRAFFVLFVLSAATSVVDAQSEKRGEESKQDVVEVMDLIAQIAYVRSDKALLKELEIFEEQIDGFEEVVKDHFDNEMDHIEDKESRQEYERLMKRGEEEEAQKIEKKMRQREEKSYEESMQSLLEKIEGIFLPHQMKRLRQIAVQDKIPLGSIGYLEAPYWLAEAIGLNASQKKQLKEETKQVIQEFHQEIAELRKSSLRKILGTLPADAQNEFEDLVGEYYDHEGAFIEFLEGESEGDEERED